MILIRISKLSGSSLVSVLIGLACLPVAAAPPDPGDRFGSIKGRVIWAGAELPRFNDLQPQGRAERDPQICAQERAIPNNALIIDVQSKGITDAIAYLGDPQGAFLEIEKVFLANAPTVTVDQKNCEFLPRITAMHEGQELIFTSSDRVIHNIHLSPLKNEGLNQLMAPVGQLRVRLLAERRAIPVQCGLHPWMHASIRVFDHPFFAKTGKDGAFEIAGIPPGEQRLIVWHERAGYLTEGKSQGMVVTVSPGKVSDVGTIQVAPGAIKEAP
ncbi:carboxypeptidase regulatory-like domain-containing protein [Singulisphaera sp. Ch08]|uniref:Carboxypeptidase regulatory-like domain-containing protein n=1 Tax=Singulisphaera sp. Ch08 TaxID=3120278 RepID=A0AAU7CJP8_9BACT